MYIVIYRCVYIYIYGCFLFRIRQRTYEEERCFIKWVCRAGRPVGRGRSGPAGSGRTNLWAGRPAGQGWLGHSGRPEPLPSPLRS